MDIVNNVKIRIAGTEYVISTTEDPAYLAEMGEYVSDVVTGLMQKNPNLSVTKALVLCCLNTQDELNQAITNTDNLRNQIKEYLEDAARSRAEADELRRENARLRNQLNKYPENQRSL